MPIMVPELKGWRVNHKNIQRLSCAEGRRVPSQRRQKQVGSSTFDASVADAPKVVWDVDLQFDTCEQGKVFKICSIVDEHTNTPGNAWGWSNNP